MELACEVPENGLISFLVYNLLLVFVCTILAFKTRHLPDNFSESLFIAMCVTSTLILWGCFIIVYTLSPLKSTRTMSMVIALLCNHSVALIFLFLSRVYAVLFGQSNIGTRKEIFVQIRKGQVLGFQILNGKITQSATGRSTRPQTTSLADTTAGTLLTEVAYKAKWTNPQASLQSARPVQSKR